MAVHRTYKQRSAHAQCPNIRKGPAQLTVTGHVVRLLREQGEDIVGKLLGLITAARPRLLAATRAAASAGSVHTVSTSTLALQEGGIQMSSLGHNHDQKSRDSRGEGAYSRTRPAAVTTSPSSPAAVMVSHRSPVNKSRGQQQALVKSDPTNPDSAAPGHGGGR
jgi:hypothetical protein